MTDFDINAQIETIKNATKKASASKESAVNFLMAAGILKPNAKKDRKRESQQIKANP
jgi:hypothetical protein